MKTTRIISVLAGILAVFMPVHAQNHWAGSKVAILGDSISDPIRVGTDRCWWEFLAELMDMQTVSFAVNGNQMSQLPAQALKVDSTFNAIIILAGTNDYFHDIPMGDWFTVAVDSVNTNGRMTPKLHRSFSYDKETFCGRCNILMH
ncbi:MAG: SGNH/GDSL hydrolase family protein, partial [Bacteroidales bacterium]|nr:SGNH/GDSL hydrolase family protein [Bacteroidales bacterium]